VALKAKSTSNVEEPSYYTTVLNPKPPIRGHGRGSQRESPLSRQPWRNLNSEYSFVAGQNECPSAPVAGAEGHGCVKAPSFSAFHAKVEILTASLNELFVGQEGEVLPLECIVDDVVQRIGENLTVDSVSL